MSDAADDLVIDGVYFAHGSPLEKDVDADYASEYAKISAGLFNNGPDDRPEYLASLSISFYDEQLAIAPDGRMQKVGSESGPLLSEFHFDADGARQLAQQLLAAADVLDLIDP